MTVPTGETEFQFSVANLSFHSMAYEWLVVSGAKAQYKGSGTINSTGSYGFILTSIDGQITGGGGSDKFRIKIFDKNNNNVIVYDNQMEAGDDATPTTILGGGTIMIHTSGKAPSSPAEAELLAAGFALYQNRPNPFNPVTVIGYALLQGSHIRLAIYDSNGRLVVTLVEGIQPPGSHEVTWHGRDAAGRAVASGVYHYKLDGPGFTETRRMVLLK